MNRPSLFLREWAINQHSGRVRIGLLDGNVKYLLIFGSGWMFFLIILSFSVFNIIHRYYENDFIIMIINTTTGNS